MPKIRQIRTEGDVAYIPLTRGYEAIIDIEDLPLVAGFNWLSLKSRHHVYAGRNEGPKEARKLILLHRLLLKPPLGFVVDHIDSNGLNNRRNNLRIATRSQNCQNSKIPTRNTSGYKGVSWNTRDEKWRSAIVVNKKLIFLGNFDCKHDAYLAYCEASNKYHGEFGRID